MLAGGGVYLGGTIAASAFLHLGNGSGLVGLVAGIYVAGRVAGAVGGRQWFEAALLTVLGAALSTVAVVLVVIQLGPAGG